MTNNEIVELAGMVSELLGTLSIAYAALAVHHRFKNEHKVDDAVFMEMSREMRIAFFGVAFMLIGFSAQVIGRFFLT